VVLALALALAAAKPIVRPLFANQEASLGNVFLKPHLVRLHITDNVKVLLI
jgi:hypothetical protein